MPFDSTAVLAQLDPLIQQVEFDVDTSDEMYGDYYKVPQAKARTMLTRMSAAVERLAAPGSVYRVQADEIVGRPQSDDRKVVWLLGVVQALKWDIEAGYLETIEEMVHADVFSDFLDRAAELLHSGHKDAAAVIAGSVLEEHLRKLALKQGLEVAKTSGAPVKADSLNAELSKASIYNALVQKQVTAWLDLRNKAAHGKYTEYDEAQVAALIRDVLDFAAKYPA